MKRLTVLLAVALVSVALASAAWALPFPITDVRALGMGGAFVAAGEGIGAVQYNPALLAKDATVGIVLPEVVARVEDHIGLEDLINDLNDFGSTDTTAVIPILARLRDGGAVDVQASGSVGAGFGLLGISAGVTYSQLIYGTAMPSLISTDPADIIGDPVGSNQLRYEAVEARQLIFSGAKSFGNVIVGANLRNIDATSYRDSVWLFDDPGTSIGDITDSKLSDETATSIDVGAVMGLTDLLDVGVVAKDINGPELGVLELDPRYRIGAALYLPMITIAADYDVTKDDSGGTEYQDWALGAELDIWAVALRGGLSNNSGLSGAPTLIHLGLGLGFLDIGAAYAEKGDYYMAGVNLALGF